MSDERNNTGDGNTGHWNTGDGNAGNMNTGNWNTGDWNAGNCNTGDRNTGDWNAGDWNTGHFNTTNPKIRMFNKETDMTSDELRFPNYFYFNLIETIDDNSKVYDYKEAWKKSFYEKCDKEQAEQTINLPNFDYDIFEEITGITKEMLDKKRGITTETSNDIITINGVKYKRCE
jgi:hypothetical protein